MKKLVFIVAVSMLFLFFTSCANEKTRDTKVSITPNEGEQNKGEWKYLGKPGFSDGEVNFISMKVGKDGKIYVAYTDVMNNCKLEVMVYEEEEWRPLGNPLSAKEQAFHPTIAIGKDNKIYVTYVDGMNGYRLAVMVYDGEEWKYLGKPWFSADKAYNPSIIVRDDGKVYVAYEDKACGHKSTVMVYDGTEWKPLGNPGVLDAKPDSLSMAIGPDGKVYVAYNDNAKDYNTIGMVYDDNEWKTLGGKYLGDKQFLPGDFRFPSIAVGKDNKVHVAYMHKEEVMISYGLYFETIIEYRIHVMEYDGKKWEYFGEPGGIVEDKSICPLIAIGPAGKTYVAYRGKEDNHKSVVMIYGHIYGFIQGWELLGKPGFSKDKAIITSIEVGDDEKVYVAYIDETNGNKATVTVYDDKK